MKQQLVIVESPAKAKTIEKFLGKDFKVLSSFGHVRDLPKKGLNIDVADNFKPTYAISPDKTKVIRELKAAVAKSSDVWLASDEDREGEAIAWHLASALKLDINKTKRIVFHEITKTALEKALEHPRTIDINLVNAQQARRILDRLVGYELSPVLWKKIRTGLSAGRVQSVSVRLIVEREREINDFESATFYKISASFKGDNGEVLANLDKNIDSLEDARKFLESLNDSSFVVSSVSKKPGKRNSSPPFTTSTLQQEASRKFGYSPRQTMSLAQRLYEAGHITYMRTDSTTLSSLALEMANTYIISNFGKEYSNQTQYKTKSDSAQEAHEAIRPTDFNNDSISGEEQQKKLYKLIWERALASQMAPAQVERTELKIGISNSKNYFLAKGEVLVFPGFYKVYGNIKDDTILPPINEGEKLDLIESTANEAFSKPPARYSEASLVKKLEELGIGRPSTYAPTVSTIQTRGYVEKVDVEGKPKVLKILKLVNKVVSEEEEQVITGADKNKLVPTSVADVTTDFLTKYFADVLDYKFTAKVEDSFDKIADGKEDWVKMLDKFYSGFHPLVEKSGAATREEVSKAKHLGDDPKSGKPVIARFGRYGLMLQRGETESEEKPDFAPFPEGYTLDNIDLEAALIMFSLPRIVGQTKDGEEITANIGRFGPYIKVKSTFVSIKDSDPFKITLEEARALYDEKLEQIANKYIAEFKSGIKIANGPYGPYITDGKKNARINKDTDPKSITEKEAVAILKNAPAKKKFKRKKKK
ncbi:MAG: type I DNA topoisomerase [bacterium]